MKGNEHILELVDVSKTFGGLQALMNVSCAVARGHIKALIGPNGAGKSTLLNVVSGLLKPERGHVYLNGRDVVSLKPERIAALRLSRTFQIIRLFTMNNATVLDNVMLGAHMKMKPTLVESVFLRRRMSREVRSLQEQASEILKFVGLGGFETTLPATLSFGNQRLLELGRALMTEPDILLLDEPASGLNDSEVETFMQLLYDIRKRGITMFLVEHNMKLVMNVADDIVVLNFGQKLAEGPPAEISSDPAVVEAYLGVEH